MTFRFDKLTTKAQEAVVAAQNLATSRGNPQIDPIHLLVALLEEVDGIVRPLLEKMNVDISRLRGVVDSELGRLTTVSGGASPSVGKELSNVLDKAMEESQAMRDDFVSTEHLLLALTEVDSTAKHTLEINGVGRHDVEAALPAVRGSAHVTDQNPEGKFQALEKYGIRFSRALRTRENLIR